MQWAHRDHGGIPDLGDPIDNDMFRAITTPPILPVYDIKAGWAHNWPLNFYDNPVAVRETEKDDKSLSWELFGNAFAEVDFLKYFTVRSNFGGNQVNYFSSRFDHWSYYATADSLPSNILTESSGYKRSWTWTNTLKFSKTLWKDHRISVLAGTEAISNYNKEVGGSSKGLYTDDVNYRALSNGSPASQQTYTLSGTSSLFAFIGQVDYGYREKYFLRGTLRRDGASFFGPLNRYGWFPSVSAAWRIAEEKFLGQAVWINELKLRASWGKSGFYGNTDPLNQFNLYGGTVQDSYYDIYGTGNSATQGFRSLRIGDPSTGWQEDIVANIGLESVFWHGKLAITIDWYKKKANGLLFPVTLPDILGGATPPNSNIGSIQNTGFDILVGSKGRWFTNWNWDATIVISAYDNKIIRINDLPFFVPQGIAALNKSYVRNEVGHPISSFYGFKVAGIFKNEDEVSKAPAQEGKAPGRFQYADVNGRDAVGKLTGLPDGKVDDDDRIYIGNPNPDFTIGFNLGINYKYFDFSAFFYGSFGNEVVNIPKMHTDFYTPATTAKSKVTLYDSWTPAHTDARLPKIELDNNFSNAQVANSYVVEDGSYFRNKSIILGYTFSKAWLEKIKIEKLRIYAQVANLFTITKYTGLDPELSGNSAAFGIDFGNFPNNQKQYLFGMNVNF